MQRVLYADHFDMLEHRRAAIAHQLSGAPEPEFAQGED
jgi:hypothetical protein